MPGFFGKKIVITIKVALGTCQKMRVAGGEWKHDEAGSSIVKTLK